MNQHALFGMVLVALMGTFATCMLTDVFVKEPNRRRLGFLFAALWFLFWAFPPLVKLWITGVLG